MSELKKILTQIQSELNVSKSHFNEFGNFKYRSAEDIEAAVKPLLLKYGLTLTLTNDLKELAGNVYVIAKATLSLGEEEISATSFAREAFEKKGMDTSQCTGCAISYANKYCLGNLFLLNDTADADALDNRGSGLTEEKLKKFCRGKVDSGEDSEIVKGFFNYYLKKVPTWNGDFNAEALFKRWLKNN